MDRESQTPPRKAGTELMPFVALGVTVLLATFGQAAWLDGKIERLDAKLSGEIHSLDAKLSGEIRNLDAKLSGEIQNLDAKLSREIRNLDAKLSGEIQNLDAKLSGEIQRVESRLTSACKTIRSVWPRYASVSQRWKVGLRPWSDKRRARSGEFLRRRLLVPYSGR